MQFSDLGLDPRLLRSVEAQGLTDPTPIQHKAIPVVLSGQDVMGLAQTGTGKTAAFGLPLIHQLLHDGEKPQPKCARALILAPTRELVNQIADSLRLHVKKSPIWVSSVVGGQSINSQIRHLAKGTDILVATPGRLIDLCDRGALSLAEARYLVLDEADQMLDLGFVHALRKIAKMLGQPRQTLLFSATMPAPVAKLSADFLKDPVRIEVSPPGTAVDKIVQGVHHVSSRDKTNLLKDMLLEDAASRSLVFARTKHGAEKLMKHLVECGFAAVSIHGNKSQGQRDRALKAFKNGDAAVMVATDVAARGIDIPAVTHVYNYQLPEVPENYVHRIGRTARAGRDGKAVALCAADEGKLLRQIEKLMNVKIPVLSGEPSTADAGDFPPPRRKGRSSPRRGGGAPAGRNKPKAQGNPAAKAEDGSSSRKTRRPGAGSSKPGEGRKPAGGRSHSKPQSAGPKPTGSKPGGGKPSNGKSRVRPGSKARKRHRQSGE